MSSSSILIFLLMFCNPVARAQTLQLSVEVEILTIAAPPDIGLPNALYPYGDSE